MNQRSNEKKLVEAFKTFFDKSIRPYLSTNEPIMNEWKYFNKLISSDPIDFNQIQFYLLLANKSHNHEPQSANEFRNSNLSQMNQVKYGTQQTPPQKIMSEITTSEKRSSNSKIINSPKKKNLLSSLESFQTLLLKNHERLQSFNRKQPTNQLTISNGNKRFI